MHWVPLLNCSPGAKGFFFFPLYPHFSTGAAGTTNRPPPPPYRASFLLEMLAARTSSLRRTAAPTPRRRSARAVRVSAAAPATLGEVVDPRTGYPRAAKKYETVIILKADTLDDEVQEEMDKLESFINSEGAIECSVMNRGRQRMAYPIKEQWEGIYVMVNFVSMPRVPKALQDMLSAPVVGGDEKNIVRYMTIKYDLPKVNEA